MKSLEQDARSGGQRQPNPPECRANAGAGAMILICMTWNWLGSAMPKKYQWFVVRGKAVLYRESDNVVLALDPEGSSYCVLSSRDAVEIAAIISEEARIIWEASDQLPAEPARVEGDVHQSCRLWVQGGVLEVIAHDTQPLVALLYNGGVHCKLDVTRAIALVQILQCQSAAVEGKS